MNAHTETNPSAVLTHAAKEIAATHCLLCRRKLNDAQSIAIGMGPDCRERVGYAMTETLPNTAFKQVNTAIRALAKLSAGGLLFAPDVIRAHKMIREAGMTGLADAIAQRLATVHIGTENDRLVVNSPYTEDFAPSIKQACPGAQWSITGKVWLVASTQRGALWSVLKRCYPSQLGMGPKGPFEI